MSETTFAPTPSVKLTAKVGGYMVGKITEMGREVLAGPAKNWKYFVYTFAIKDTDLPVNVEKVKGSKKYDEVEPEDGDTVSIFATKSLHKLLSVFDLGMTVKITYNGTKPASKAGLSPAHDFTVKFVPESVVPAGGK